MLEKVSLDQKFNLFYRSIFPWRDKPLELIEKVDKEVAEPINRKGHDKKILVYDLVQNPNSDDVTFCDKKWLNKICNDNSLEQTYINYLVTHGFTEEQAQEIIQNSLLNAHRCATWSTANESLGKRASDYISAAMVIGAIKELFASGENTPQVTKLLLNLAHGFCLGKRGQHQFTLYGLRGDDDLAQNQYEADIYGNKIAASFGEAATFMETKINPLVLPVLSLFSDKTRENIADLLSLPNSLWWRVRMGAHVNQEFLTDLCRYIFHKPLTLFGNKQSKEIISKVKERGNIDPAYVLERHFKNAGLLEKNKKTVLNLIKQTLKLLINSFNVNAEIQTESAKRFNEVVAPTIGVFSFLTQSTGTVLKVFPIVGQKAFDLLSSIGSSAQHFLYLFRLVIPDFNEAKRIREVLDKQKKNISADEIKELGKMRGLYEKKNRYLKMAGLYSFLSVANPLIKLWQPEGEKLKKAKGLIQELTTDLIYKYFSSRRHMMGYQFKVENPEFYEEDKEVEPIATKVPQFSLIGV